jgi:hypothetical protein
MISKTSIVRIRILIWLGAIFFSGWWILINVVIRDPNHNNNINQAFAALYGAMALLAGIIGLVVSRKWGGIKSLVGRALLFFTLGSLAQEFGQLAYSFYLYALKISIPYPSLGDVGYFGSVLFYMYAALLLAKAAGVNFSLKQRSRKVIAVTLPLVLLIASYALFLRNYQFDFSSVKTCLSVVLDFGYPFGQALYIGIALITYLLSQRLLGGVMKHKILLLLFALFVQYVADFSFLVAAKQQTFYTAGINDFLYLLAYSAMAFGLSSFLVLGIEKTQTETGKELGKG